MQRNAPATLGSRRLIRTLAATLALALAACGGGGDPGVADAVNGNGSDVAAPGGPGDTGSTGATGDSADAVPLSIGGTPTPIVAQGTQFRFRPEISGASAGAVLSFSVANLPGWAVFDPGNGEIMGTPEPADAGTYADIVVSVFDGDRSASMQAFAIEVVATASASARLSWTAPTENADGTALTDLAGFKVYWGSAVDELSFSAPIDNPSISIFQIDELAPAQWFFAVTAVDSAGNESALSEVVSAQIG